MKRYQVKFTNEFLGQSAIIDSFDTYEEAQQYIFQEEKTDRGKKYEIIDTKK